MTLRSIHTAAQRSAMAYPRRAIIFAAAMWAKRTAHKIWMGMREWCGDCAYERYLLAQRTIPGESVPLSPAEFYLEQLHRRYSRPNRCC
ncbi:MAG TPA: CstA-like transporter-associated (seleno)protein [Candidatus Acidoferrum sp.]